MWQQILNAFSSLRPRPRKVPDQSKTPPISIADFEKQIALSQQFLPFAYSMLNRRHFAITGTTLEQYQRSRHQDSKLPDKSVKAVQELAIAELVDGLKLSHEMAFASKPGGDHEAVSQSRLILRSVRINMPDDALDFLLNEAAEAKGKGANSDTNGVPLTTDEKAGPNINKATKAAVGAGQSFTVKFKHLQPLLVPGKSLRAPENPLVQALKERIAQQQRSHRAPAESAADEDA